ncbi:unnamed protein product [Effrenium voratum]|nr:unnamed protein product [Effrenium voratum]
MSEFLDALDDAGVEDRETRLFLVEALSNAEEEVWSDVLEPFVNGGLEACLASLKKEQVLQKSLTALQKEEKHVEEKISPLAVAFLQVLHPGVLYASGLHTVATCSRLCRQAHEAACQGDLWQFRTVATCQRWNLQPKLPRGTGKARGVWQKHFLQLTRPRCDGVYVSECGFQRWLRVGHHSDLRKNAAQLAAYGGRGGQSEWVGYRRFLRLLPPQDGCHALVLIDPCPRDVAEAVLVDGVDLATHRNPARSEGVPEGAVPNAHDADRIRKRICVGTYSFSQEGAMVHVRYTATDGEYRLTFSLKHGPKVCSDCLTWEEYELHDHGNQDIVPFNLGRLPEWKGGGLEDENKDHFPQMNFRPKLALEHLA